MLVRFKCGVRLCVSTKLALGLPSECSRHQLGIEVLGSFLDFAVRDAKDVAVGVVVGDVALGVGFAPGLHRYVVAVRDEIIGCETDTAIELRGERRESLVEEFLLAIERFQKTWWCR